MIRKQLYLEAGQDAKVKRLARRFGCSESDVIRQAIDRFPDAGRSPEEALWAAGALVAPPGGEDLNGGADLDELERELDQWSATLPGPIGLAEAVAQDRR